jgi:hypothetical protein
MYFFSVCKTSAQVKSVDSVVSRAFNSIKNEDEQAYLKLFPTFAQLKTLLNDIVKSVPDSAQKMTLAQAFSKIDEETFNSELKTKTGKSFREFISDGKMKGIVWSRTRLDSFTTTEEKESAIDLKKVSGKLFFSDQDKEYVIRFSDIIWFKDEQGWFGFEMNKVQKKEDANLLDDDRINNDDSISKMEWDTVTVNIDSTLVNTVPAKTRKQNDKKPVTKKPEAKQPAKKPSTTKPKTKS